MENLKGWQRSFNQCHEGLRKIYAIKTLQILWILRHTRGIWWRVSEIFYVASKIMLKAYWDFYSTSALQGTLNQRRSRKSTQNNMLSNFTLPRMRAVLTETSLIWTISLLELIWKARHLHLFEFRRMRYWILFLRHCLKALIPRTFSRRIYCSKSKLTLAFLHAFEIRRGWGLNWYSKLQWTMCCILNSAKRLWTV